MTGRGRLATARCGTSPQPSQLYDSLPLARGSSCVRLLDLDSDRTSPLGRLNATLRVASLASCPRYAALSYVWKDQSPDIDVVTCNDCDVQVTKTCYEALSSLVRMYGTITVWVDALCTYSVRSKIKALRNLRCLIPHLEEPNRDLQRRGSGDARGFCGFGELAWAP